MLVTIECTTVDTISRRCLSARADKKVSTSVAKLIMQGRVALGLNQKDLAMVSILYHVHYVVTRMFLLPVTNSVATREE